MKTLCLIDKIPPEYARNRVISKYERTYKIKKGYRRIAMNKQQLAIQYNYRNKLKKKRLNSRRLYLTKKYGLSVEQYENMVLARNGCDICHKVYKQKYYHIDHDHKTGKVRGLLCAKCNRALGYFGDNIAGLQKAIDYLNS